jgi:hypothetical protein
MVWCKIAINYKILAIRCLFFFSPIVWMQSCEYIINFYIRDRKLETGHILDSEVNVKWISKTRNIVIQTQQVSIIIINLFFLFYIFLLFHFILVDLIYHTLLAEDLLMPLFSKTIFVGLHTHNGIEETEVDVRIQKFYILLQFYT